MIVFNPFAMKRARRSKKMSYEAVAGALSARGLAVSYGTVRNWEVQKPGCVPNANEIQALAVVLGVEVNRLYKNTKGRAGARNLVA